MLFVSFLQSTVNMTQAQHRHQLYDMERYRYRYRYTFFLHTLHSCKNILYDTRPQHRHQSVNTTQSHTHMQNHKSQQDSELAHIHCFSVTLLNHGKSLIAAVWMIISERKSYFLWSWHVTSEVPQSLRDIWLPKDTEAVFLSFLFLPKN